MATARETVFPKTHDLELLVHLCVQAGGDFDRLIDAARELTPLATEFRYPGDVAAPSVQEAERALAHAEAVIARVMERW